MTKQEEILELLKKKKILTEAQVNQATEQAAAKQQAVEDFLLETKLVEPEKLTEVKAQAYGLQYENLTAKKVIEFALNTLPTEVAENYKMVCFDRESTHIKVGVIDPDNFKAIEAVQFLAKEQGLFVQFFLVSNNSFTHVFRQYRSLSKEISVALKLKEDEEEERKEQQKKEEEEIEEIIGSAPVIKIVSVILRHAVEGGASDIHIEPMQKEARVRYRIDGILRTSLVLPRNIHEAIVARVKVLSNLKLDETRIPQDGRIRQVINGKEVDFRVSTLPLVSEEKVVMRVLDVTKGAPTLEDLGFGGRSLATINENIKKTNKMFLVVGPTGSGKSTTLYSVLHMVNKEGVNISTLEDPVEYFMPGVNQSQVRPEVGFTFASGLRALLRQDPNIIMVGEIRDSETAELAIHASLTGHFVLSTMHTNSAVGTIPRLLDMKVEAFLLGSTLSTVLAQRLARKICQHCKVEDAMPDDLIAEVRQEFERIPKEIIAEEFGDQKFEKLVFFKGKGCPRCGNSGYAGRVAVAEIVDVNDDLRHKIIEQGHAIKDDDIRESQIFISMMQDGIIKSLKGLTTIQEVMRVMRD